MNQSGAAPGAAQASSEPSLCAWFGFWVQFLVLGLLAVFGAFFAGGDGVPGDETCGLILIVAAIALAFLRLKSSFDGGPSGWGASMLVSDMPNLALMTVIFVILGMAGLFVAAGVEQGGLHNGGVALFVASGLGVFLSLKNVFDNFDRHG